MSALSFSQLTLQMQPRKTIQMRSDPLTKEVRSALIRGKLTFFLGAGISVYRRSFCPDWNRMVTETLRAIAPGGLKSKIESIFGPHMKLLFNEFLFNQMQEIMEQGSTRGLTHTLLKACLDSPYYSGIHRFVACCSRDYNARVMTTNFDMLLEKAGQPKERLLKLHGSLDEPKSARFTIDSVCRPLPRTLRAKMETFLSRRLLVVGGYGGMDEFDIMPALFRREASQGPRKIIWLQHPSGDLDPSVFKRFDEWMDGSGKKVVVVKADFDEFAKSIMEMAPKLKSNSDLSKWVSSGDDPTDVVQGWWHDNLEEWVHKVRVRDPVGIKYFWARLLDHLSLYKIRLDGSTRNLARKAYQRVLAECKKSPKHAPMRMESQVMLSYAQRTTSTKEQMSHCEAELRQLVRVLRSKLRSAQGAARRQYLNTLGRAQHELGHTLQGQLLFDKASLEYKKALETRASAKDPQLPYTRFQLFMNAYRAFEVSGRLDQCENLVETHWRSSLTEYLRGEAATFKSRYRFKEYAETTHNLAFVHQAVGEIHRWKLETVKSIKSFDTALKLYEKALEYRLRIRDPRMIAQSHMRIAQCKQKLLQQLVLHDGVKARRTENLKRCEEIRSHLESVRSIYESTPQQDFRLDHLKDGERVLKETERHLKHSSGALNTGDPFPVFERASNRHVDDVCCHFRASTGKRLGVLVAVFDERIMKCVFVKLGYEEKRYNDYPWVLPGGAVEPGEKPSDAAVRELHEETHVEMRKSQIKLCGAFPRPDFQPRDTHVKGELLLVYTAIAKRHQLSQMKADGHEILDCRLVSQDFEKLVAIPETGTSRRNELQPILRRHVYWARLAQSYHQNEYSGILYHPIVGSSDWKSPFWVESPFPTLNI